MRKLSKNQRAVLTMLPVAGMVVIILFALLNIGTYINGTIANELIGTFPATLTDRTALQNQTAATLENITSGYDNTVEIIVVAALITVITIPLMAVIAIKRLI